MLARLKKRLRINNLLFDYTSMPIARRRSSVLAGDQMIPRSPRNKGLLHDFVKGPHYINR